MTSDSENLTVFGYDRGVFKDKENILMISISTCYFCISPHGAPGASRRGERGGGPGRVAEWTAFRREVRSGTGGTDSGTGQTCGFRRRWDSEGDWALARPTGQTVTIETRKLKKKHVNMKSCSG